MPGSVRRRGIGVLVLAALAACAGERPEGSAGAAAHGVNTTETASAGAAPRAQSGSAAVPGGPASAVAPPGTASAGEGGAPAAVQPSDPLAMDSLPPQPDAAEARRLAAGGARIFRAKGCTRCHTVGDGDRDGPDLAGITERRSYAWIVTMLTQPEYMVQADHTAQQLLIEHFLEMPNPEITVEEARAVYAYLLAGGG